MKTRAEEIEDKVKAWLFPSLVTILAALIWKDVSELKADVKALLAQSNIDKTRIDNIERQVFGSKASITVITKSSSGNDNKDSLIYNKELVIFDNKERKKPSIYLKKSKNVI